MNSINSAFNALRTIVTAPLVGGSALASDFATDFAKNLFPSANITTPYLNGIEDRVSEADIIVLATPAEAKFTIRPEGIGECEGELRAQDVLKGVPREHYPFRAAFVGSNREMLRRFAFVNKWISAYKPFDHFDLGRLEEVLTLTYQGTEESKRLFFLKSEGRARSRIFYSIDPKRDPISLGNVFALVSILNSARLLGECDQILTGDHSIGLKQCAIRLITKYQSVTVADRVKNISALCMDDASEEQQTLSEYAFTVLSEALVRGELQDPSLSALDLYIKLIPRCFKGTAVQSEDLDLIVSRYSEALSENERAKHLLETVKHFQDRPSTSDAELIDKHVKQACYTLENM